MKYFLSILFLSCALTCFAWDIVYLNVPTGAHEADWRDALAKEWNGKTEQVIEFGRIDVETESCVIEIDFLSKWCECLGQSLFYANSTGKQGIGAIIVLSKTNYMLNMQKLIMIEKLFNKYDITLVILLPIKRENNK